jgi:hypothetical protein
MLLIKNNNNKILARKEKLVVEVRHIWTIRIIGQDLDLKWTERLVR